MVAMTLALVAAVHGLLLPRIPPADLPTAMLRGRVRDGWVVLDHLGGDALVNVTVRTRVDGVPWDRPGVELAAGRTANVSRPAPDDGWAVEVEVTDRGWTVFETVVRDGTREGRGPDLVPSVRVDRAAGRITATVWNLGPGPTPEGRHALVWFWVDGEDPSLNDSAVHFPSWRSNRNHTPAPVAPGGVFTRVRTFDPALLPAGPHAFEVVVNINKAGHSNLDEVRYDNNRAATTA